VPVLTADSASRLDVTVPGAMRPAPAWAGERVRIGAGPVSPGVAVVSFAGGNLTVVARELGASYPRYEGLLRTEAAGLIVADRAAFQAQTRRVAALVNARGRDGLIAVAGQPGSITIAPYFPDRPDASVAPELPATVSGNGNPNGWLFHARRLLDAIDSVPGPTVTLHTPWDTSTPVLFTETPEGGTDPTAYRQLLMPVHT
jgi:DNA polymerase III sliding clamp (beta) subunit (PCNA family)